MRKLMHINPQKVKTAVVIYASKKNDPHKDQDPFLRDIIYYYLVSAGSQYEEVFTIHKIPTELIDKYDSVIGALGAVLERETLDWNLGFMHLVSKREFFEQLLPEDEELLPINFPIYMERYMEIDD